MTSTLWLAAVAGLGAFGCGDNRAGPVDAAPVDARPPCEYPIAGVRGTACDFELSSVPIFEDRRYRLDTGAGEVVHRGEVIATFELAVAGDLAILRVESLVIEADAIVEAIGDRPLIIAVDGDARIDGALVVDGSIDGAGSAASRCGDRPHGFGGHFAGVGGPPGGGVADGILLPVPRVLRAGCPASDVVPGRAARPGGGIQISSPAAIAIAGSISASGEGGAGAEGGGTSGGAGGASGGMIIIDGPGQLSGSLCADGGGGGGGAGPGSGDDGEAGEAASCGSRATGGAGIGGDGGPGSGGGEIDGGAGSSSGAGTPGGGGGAAGYILISDRFDTGAGAVSPPPLAR